MRIAKRRLTKCEEISTKSSHPGTANAWLTYTTVTKTNNDKHSNKNQLVK